MSGFFGELRSDGGPVDPGSIGCMAEAIAWYGRDGRELWHRGPVGLGVLQRCDTPESRFEPPILRSGRGPRRILAGNYRIDNRDALIEALKPKPGGGRPVTDGELILAAHEAWGDGCAERLIGDFALALWDAPSCRLLLIRDQIGVAPLFYYPIEGGLLFASDLRALAAHPKGPRTLDPAALAHHLRDAQYDLGDGTYLAGVRRLRPGHCLFFAGGASTIARYWSPERVPRVRLPSADDYAKRLRVLFEQAVACRLRSPDPVGSHLSGGLDSTSIAFEAQRQLRQRSAALAGTFTWLSHPRSADEAVAPEYAATRRAETALGMEAESVDLTPAALLRELDRNIALEGFANLWYEGLVRDKAAARGIRTLLSGWGGDEVVSSGGNGCAAELFWRGRWGRLARFIARRSTGPQEGPPGQRPRPPWRRALGLVYGQILMPSLPGFLYRCLPRTRLTPLPGFDPNEPLLAPLNGRLPPPPCWQRKIGKGAEMARMLTAGHLQDRIEAWSMQGARDGIRYLYPLLDLRLVEFCLGAPPELFVSSGQTRWLFREAMRGLLPDEIRLASVKFEHARVSRLLETLSMALCQSAQQGPERTDPAPLGDCLSLSRRRQVEAMRPAAHEAVAPVGHSGSGAGGEAGRHATEPSMTV